MIQALILARRQGPLIVACVIVLALVTGAYVQGRASGKASRDEHYRQMMARRELELAQAAAESTKRAIDEATRRIETANAIERRHLEEQLARAQRQKVITKVVKEYVRANPALDRCHVDTDGLRLWNAANTGQPARAGTSRAGTAAGRKRP